jgi:hypothetical protein
MLLHFNQWSVFEDPRRSAVEPCMKTKHLFGLVAVVTVTGFAASAQAGWSVGVSIGVPVQYSPPVVYCPPPVTYCPPPVVYYPPPVAYCPPPVRYYAPPVVYVAPRYERHYDNRDYRGHDRGRDGRGWGHNDRGHGNGGRR